MGKRDIRTNFFVLVAMVVLLTAILPACTAANPQSPGAQANPSVGAPEEIQRVTLEESKAAFDSNSAVFLDVRSADSYATSHIPGALSIPLDEFETRINELDPDQWIITYCTRPAEESSARAAQFLLQNGFTHVNPVLGGFGAWLSAGYPVESGQ